MRAISHLKKYSVGCIPYRERPAVMGIEVLCPGYVAQFKIGDVTDAEMAFAREVFVGHMHGVTYEADEITPTSPLARLSTYDLNDHLDELAVVDRDTFNPKTKDYGMEEGWAKGLVIEALTARQSSEMRVVEEVRIQAPWPTFDTFRGSIDDLAMKVIDDGLSLDQAIAYERQNLNRADVLAAFEEARALVEVPDGEVITA